MPRRRRFRSRRRFRRVRRRTRRFGRRFKRGSSSYARTFAAIVPDRQFVKLRCHNTVSYSGFPAGGFNVRANSLYDPYGVNTTQPAGYDQWALLYQRYRVHGCKIRLLCSPNATETQPFQFVLWPSDNLVALTTEQAIQQPYARWKVCQSKNPDLKQMTLSGYMKTNKISGEPRKKSVYDDVYSSFVTGAPGFLWYWRILNEALDTVSNISGEFVISLTFYAEFYRRTSLFDV